LILRDLLVVALKYWRCAAMKPLATGSVDGAMSKGFCASSAWQRAISAL
jgi:hypothetical protein